MFAGLVIAAIAVACAPKVPMGASESKARKMFCFAAELRHRKGRSGLACLDTLSLCEEALGTARRVGSMAGITRLGRCRLIATEDQLAD